MEKVTLIDIVRLFMCQFLLEMIVKVVPKETEEGNFLLRCIEYYGNTMKAQMNGNVEITDF